MSITCHHGLNIEPCEKCADETRLREEKQTQANNEKLSQIVSSLLPCPFCGEKPSGFRTDDIGKWGWVECCCQGPEVRTGWDDFGWQQYAADEWNKRA